eukprot:GHVU01111630.1.p3 GENE.GHVU01111630.1~~GHVU01111630.1.p3  ORF type:complete len:113 (-),score=15.87 GHVU01111630.1:571-909(-)
MVVSLCRSPQAAASTRWAPHLRTPPQAYRAKYIAASTFDTHNHSPPICSSFEGRTLQIPMENPVQRLSREGAFVPTAISSVVAAASKHDFLSLLSLLSLSSPSSHGSGSAWT